jgi:hypothetical protein
MNQWLSWALPIAAAAHVFEEFVFPGGFKEWYGRYRPETIHSFTPTFAVVIRAAGATRLRGFAPCRLPCSEFRTASRGRDAGAPPAQIPACGFPAPGSSVTLASALS